MDALKPVPTGYLEDAEHGGTIVRVDYTTNSTEDTETKIDKFAYVYLPYGYDETKQYKILYCLHGGGGEIEVYFGEDGTSTSTNIKRLLDHMIANGNIDPIVAVSPTYYVNRGDGKDFGVAVSRIENFCKNELVNDLIPAIEGKYSTYAKSTDLEGIKASRDHRAYAGYSMGSLSTWYTFVNSLDYFSYFMPMSGDCWVNGVSNAQGAAEWLENVVTKSGYKKEDFFIYAVTGDEDIAYTRMDSQIHAMKTSSPSFQFVTEDSAEGNICFRVEPGATHDYYYMPLFFYNALPTFWRK